MGLGDFVDFLKGRVPDESIRNKKAEPRRRISRSRKKANADEERKAKKALKYKPMKAEEVVLQQFAAAQMYNHVHVNGLNLINNRRVPHPPPNLRGMPPPNEPRSLTDPLPMSYLSDVEIASILSFSEAG